MYYEEQVDPTFWQYYVVLFVLSLIVTCLLANTMANLIEHVSPDLRTMPPQNAWLSVIPAFGSFWIFYVVYQLSVMLREEYARRKIVEFESSPGLSSGIGFCFTLFLAQLTLMFDTPIVCTLLYVAAIALLVVYWVKLINYRRKIQQNEYERQMQQQQSPAPSNYETVLAPSQNPYENSNWQPPQNIPPPAPPEDWERWRPK